MSVKCVINRFFFTFSRKVVHVQQHVSTFLAEQLGYSLRVVWDGNLVAKLFQFALLSKQRAEFLQI